MKYFFPSILGIILIFVLQCNSLGAEYGKTAVVDIQQFQKNSQAFQKTRQALKKKFEALQKTLDEEKRKLLKIEEAFKKQSMMLSLDAQEDKKRALDKQRRYYKYIYEDLSQEMKNSEIEATKKVGKELEKIVTKIGKEEGYIIILEKRTVGLIYYDDSIDITNQVIQAYDKMKQ